MYVRLCSSVQMQLDLFSAQGLLQYKYAFSLSGVKNCFSQTIEINKSKC